ncbi:Na(), H() antiporter [Fructilactobacillus florum 8D]|uniref:Na(), H() antiporter n=1 Tax=Fructilactobacillus florum 8D TaxID=1221538 RepID=W9EFE5_9LACO|nr:cation:proton antiporter family protein [Fructilactobacillus florum]EKK20592.1 Na(), H() antiporter [Fructilactobacillus florum 2F]ETO40802.1 Na(), H() antiporter [Fructilactobacillus florum 8D]
MQQLSIVIILLAALITPLLLNRFQISALPTSVVEILVGIALGPSLLNLIQNDGILKALSGIGVIVLLFLSGLEIDFGIFRPGSKNPSQLEQKQRAAASKYSPLKLAGAGYFSIMVLSLLLGFIMKLTGLFNDLWLAAILFMTVSLGVVISALKERDTLGTSFGQIILLISALGEIVPIIGLTIYASLFGTNSKSLWLTLIVFAVAGLLLYRFRNFFKHLDQINKSTTQVDVRLAFFMIALLSLIAVSVGSEAVLGAFVGGMVYKLLQPSESTREKLDSIGYGFFIPIFFIMSGVGLNLRQLLSTPSTLLLIPLILAGYLIAKLMLYPILRLRFNRKNALAGTALPMATITMVLAILNVAAELKVITPQQSGDFLLAAIITCVVGPLTFNHFFNPAKDIYHNIKLNIFGVNIVTIPLDQQLSRSWYDVMVYTANPKSYESFNSEANVSLLPTLDAEYLSDHGYFDCDIALFAYLDAEKNYQLAKAAKRYGVKRVIARFEDRNVKNSHEKELTSLGVEVYNTFSISIAMLRELIEVPSTFNMIKSNETVIHEVTLKNQNYIGIPLRQLPFIDQITINRIFRKGKIVQPTGDTTLQLNDRIIFSTASPHRSESNRIRSEIAKLN